MATIYNSQLSKEIIEAARIQVNRDSVPNQIADKVVPVMEVNPKLLRLINIVETSSKTTTGALTAYTTPTDREFYLKNVTFSIIKDATCDIATGVISLNVIRDGVSKGIIAIPLITLTAQSITITENFDTPIKIDKNTAISTTTTAHTVGVYVKATCIKGFTIDNPNA
jgi:hypothetical protein